MSKLTDKQVADSKKDRTSYTVATYASYYRANIHRFATEYLGISLKLFQKILLYLMDNNDMFYYVAARGLGKQNNNNERIRNTENIIIYAH